MMYPPTIRHPVQPPLLESVRPPDVPRWRGQLFILQLFAIAICFEQAVEVSVFKPYRILGVLAFLAVMFNGRLRYDRFAGFFWLYLCVGVALAATRLLWSGESLAGLGTTAAIWLFNLLVYVAIISTLRSKREVALLAGVHAVAMSVAAVQIARTASENLAMGQVARLSGDFKNPANACLSMLFAGLVLIEGARRRASRSSHSFAFGAVAVLGNIGLLYVTTLTGSRAGSFIFIAGLLCYGLVVGRSFVRRSLLTAFLIVPFIIPLVHYLDPGRNILLARLESKGLELDRLYLWRAGWDAFLEHGAVGLGLDQYRPVHRRYFASYASRSDPRWLDSDLTLHNDVVIALVEFGPVGLILFWLLAKEIVRKTLTIRGHGSRAVAIAVIAMAATNSLTHATLPFFGLWFYFGLIGSWAQCDARLGVATGVRDTTHATSPLGARSL